MDWGNSIRSFALILFDKLQTMKELILFGSEDFSQIAYEYFTHDSDYTVTAFTLDKEYITKEIFCGLPVIPFEEFSNPKMVSNKYFYAAISYGQLNRVRQEKFLKAKLFGFSIASYISSRAFVWPNVKLGEHNFVFEDNVIQPFVKIGHNNVIWSSNHIGHHSTIGDNCFLASEIGMSGWVTIENYCFLGTNCSISNGSKIGNNSWISEGTSIGLDIPSGSFVNAVNSGVQALDLERLERKLREKSSRRFRD